jgi:hypothetical protein
VLARVLFAGLLALGLVGSSIGQDKKDDKKTNPAASGGSADLKWKFEKGKTFYQDMTTETKQTMKVMGMDIAQNQKQTFIFAWTPKDQDKDGNWTIQQKIEAVKMDIDIGGNKVAYDSTKDTGTANPLADFFKALVGSEFTLTVSPDGKVTKVEGRDEFLKKLVTANQQMEPMLKQILSDDALKQMAEPAFAVVPNKAVKKGDSWTRESKLNMGPIGSYDTTYKYTFEGQDPKDKALDKISVETTLKYTPPAEGTATQLPFKIKKADLKSSEAKGSVLFNPAKGRVASSELSLKLDGKLSIEIGGMTTEVDLSQTQTTTVKTTDENPVAKKAS